MSLSSITLRSGLHLSQREKDGLLGIGAILLSIYLPIIGLPVSVMLYRQSKTRFEPNRLALLAAQIAAFMLATLAFLALVVSRLGV